MPKRIDLTGGRYGKLLVLSEITERVNKRIFYSCKCDCGVIKAISSGDLSTGNSRSCGCMTRENAKKSNTKHGLSSHPIYHLWRNVKKRCYDIKGKYYHNYGGRGIKMYFAWEHDFIEFKKWCEDNGWANGLEIDRENTNGHYEPSNCRFVSRLKNARNKRNTKKYSYNGAEHTIAEWAEIKNISKVLLSSRIAKGVFFEKAITTPVMPKGNNQFSKNKLCKNN